MTKICLLEWSDSNMAGDDWSWQITLTFRKDKTYSVGAKQFIKGPYANTVPSIYPLRNGKEIKEAIETIFQDVNLSSAYFEWHEIISAISCESPKLAMEIEECLKPVVTKNDEISTANTSLAQILPEKIQRLEAKYGSENPYVIMLKQQLKDIHNQSESKHQVWQTHVVKRKG